MAALADRVQNALDEARILVLGAQIFIGFEYRVFFEPEFPSLPWWARLAKLGALCLTLGAFAMLVLPTPYHRLIDGGEDTLRLHRVTTRAVAAALLPLGVGLSRDLGLVAYQVFGRPAPAALFGAGSLMLFLATWFGLALGVRTTRRRSREVHTSA